MKSIKFYLAILAAWVICSAAAADRLAVAEPVGKGIKAADIEALWGILEVAVQSDEYELVSRNALKQMLTEIGLTESSDLVNLNSKQRAQLGKLEGVKYILVTEVAKFGSRLNCTMKIMDASTGLIDQKRTANLRVKDLDELADRIEYTVEKLLADQKNLPALAILKPQIRTAGVAEYFADDFMTQLESSLINNNVQVQNLKSVTRILQQNKIGQLDEIEPKLYRRVGDLLEVKHLLQPSVTRFEVALIPYHVAETGAEGVRRIGYFEGNIRVVSSAKGTVVATVPFEGKVDFRKLKYQQTKDWQDSDYGKYLIRQVMTQQIVPALIKVKELKNEE